MTLAVAVSHTAPQVSLVELDEERKALSNEQVVQADADVQGTHDGSFLVETEDMLKEGSERMQNEIDKMNLEDKQSYLDALQKCPELVERETPFLKFLRATDFDAKVSEIASESWHWPLELANKFDFCF